MQGGDVIDSMAMEDQAGFILVNLVKHDPDSVPLEPAGHILVDLFNHDMNYVPTEPSWSHFD
jgi:hypothetical protein